MLALPIMTGLSGFYPSLAAFFAVWAFMTLTGLLLVEVNSGFTRRVNFISMVDKTLGKKGRVACWLLYLFLFYSILLAYISAIGSLVSKIFEKYIQIIVPSWAGSFFFVFVFGWIVYLGTRPVDMWNRAFMVGKIGAFLGLVLVGASRVQASFLERSAIEYSLYSLPILVISFGFHNMIPSLTHYMGGNIKKVRKSIILGGILSLIIYLIWQIVVLGIIPYGGKAGLFESYQSGSDATQALISLLNTQWVGVFATLLGFFAILTSFLAQSLSLSHFLGDGLKVDYQRHQEFSLVALALVPPLVFAMIYPGIFLKALDFAGGICAVILFGVMPVLMAWKGRYREKISTPYRVFGGKPLLAIVFLFAIFISFFQLSKMFNAPYLPPISRNS